MYSTSGDFSPGWKNGIWPSLSCSSVTGIWKRSRNALRSEEHTSELQSLMRISYAVFCLKKKSKLITNPYHQKEQETETNVNKQKQYTKVNKTYEEKYIHISILKTYIKKQSPIYTTKLKSNMTC